MGGQNLMGRGLRRLSALALFVCLGLGLSACDSQPQLDPEQQDQFFSCVGGEEPRTAIESCTRLIELGNGGPRYQAALYFSRGVHQTALERFYHAIEDFSAAIIRAPDFAPGYSNRAGAYEHTFQYSRALQDVEVFLKREPESVMAVNYMAWLLATCPQDFLRDGPRAVPLAEQAIWLQPSYVTVDTLAAAYARAGKFKAAAHEQRRAIILLNQVGGEDLKLFGDEFNQRLGLYERGRAYAEFHSTARHLTPPEVPAEALAVLAKSSPPAAVAGTVAPLE